MCFKTTVTNYGFIIIITKNIFYGYYDKKYFKNNIKITTPLKETWIKNNYKTTVTKCGFMIILIKNIFKIILKLQHH